MRWGTCAAGRRLSLLLAAAVCVWLTACAQGVPLSGQQPSTHLTGAADSPLAQAYTPPGGDAALSGVALLGDPLQALASRVLLARTAQRGLDVQVYIWRPDVSGHVLLHELWRAAQRGVRVRLLLDDNGSAGMDIWLQALAAQPGVEVRLFNPFRQREFKLLGYLTDFQRLNRRMHDKSFTADSRATIVGGRNVGDEYFGGDPALLFSDVDLLALGPAAQATARLFDSYWNSPLAAPLAAVVDPAEPAELARHQQLLATPGSTPEAARLMAGLQTTPWLASPLAAYPLTQWAPVVVLSDSPDKVDASLPVDAASRRMVEPLSAATHAASTVSWLCRSAPKKSAPASRPTSASSSAGDIKAKLLQIHGAVRPSLPFRQKTSNMRYSKLNQQGEWHVPKRFHLRGRHELPCTTEAIF
jgi:putative cardiolipin synthase